MPIQYTLHKECQVRNGVEFPFFCLDQEIREVLYGYISVSIESNFKVIVSSNSYYLFIQVGEDRLDFVL
jgi:hypothetical protein